ncbi:hypothetical protein [Cutibacterium modestum]|nr:hypothetical protein [Cutibacterium modestum]
MSGLMAVMTVVTTAVTGAVAMTASGPTTASSVHTSRVDREIAPIVIGSVTNVADPRGIVTSGAETVVDSTATVTTAGIVVTAAVASTVGVLGIGARIVTIGVMIVGMSAGQTARITAATTGPVTIATTPTTWIGRLLS